MTRFGMWMMVSVLVSAAFVLAEPADVKSDERAPASTGANERLGQSYIFMTRGEQAWQANDPAKAAENYSDALELLESIELDYPGWATHLVRSRILTCESAIEKLREGKPAEKESLMETADEGDAPGKGINFALSSESSETAIKALKAGVEERDAALTDLRAELLSLKKENSNLKSRLEQLDRKPEGTDSQAIPSILKSQARQLLATGATSNAVALLKEMKVVYPKDDGVVHLLGAAYCRQSMFDDAVRELEPLIKHGPVSADLWLTLGVSYMGTGNLGKARQAFEEGLELDPKLPEAHFNLAQILIRMKKPNADLARRHYMQGIEQGSERDQNLEIAINQALLYEQAKKLR